MKTMISGFVCLCLVAMIMACNEKKTAPVNLKNVATVVENDSTVYGTCTDGTSMHVLQLLTNEGDTVDYVLIDEDDEARVVMGGLMAGDKMAVVGHISDGENVADAVINTTTLLGHWTSIDKNFEIQEGGIVKSNVKAETSPWTSWKILNGRLILNKDTFSITSLGADSLYLENEKGIYAYKRQ